MISTTIAHPWIRSIVTALAPLFLAGLIQLASGERALAEDTAKIDSTSQLTCAETKDLDDMCIWVQRDNPGQSTVIASDKSANRVVVYSLDGQNLQTLIVPKPGNIDIRQNVFIDGKAVDLVVVNQRSEGFKLVVFRVDPESRQLKRIDDNCATGPNYGGCLFHSRKTGKVYFVCTSETGTVEQHELSGNGKAGVVSRKVRGLAVGKCEGAVADDETGNLYISEEKTGVWKFDAEPDGPDTGVLIAKVGEHGLKGDVEGLALYSKNGGGYLLVSDQGRSRFQAYQRHSPHQYVGEFAVRGATHTDGIDVSAVNLGALFPEGLFACHTDQTPRSVLLAPWHEIDKQLSKDRSGK